MMESRSIESVYSILSRIVKLKFHKQLKDSGIDFKQIYKMTNLSTGKENYLLGLNNDQIRFTDTDNFIFHFSNYLISSIKYLHDRCGELKRMEINEFTDDAAIEMEYKESYHQLYKQKELLDMITKLKKDQPNRKK